MSDTDDRGMRTVLASLNGQTRPVTVSDRSVSVEVITAEKADPNQSGHVPAPFAGVTTLSVEPGQQVKVGDIIATIEAMKMEAAITAPVAGSIQRAAVAVTQSVEAGDLLVVIGPEAG